MAEYLMGIDIGTSACKLTVFNRYGTAVEAETVPYNLYYPGGRSGWVEQNPDEWWEAVCEGCRNIMSRGNVKKEEIISIGISGQSWSAVAVDRYGKVLCNTPIWMDTRSESICDDLKRRFGEEYLFSVCGNPVSPTYSLPKILWYKENLPEVYKNTDKILQSNSFIAYRLTGVVSQDYSQGYGFACFNMRNSKWNFDLCRDMGVNPDLLPELADCHKIIGAITKESADATFLNEGTAVVAGGVDSACSTLGAGVTENGESQEHGGQSGGMSLCLDEYKADSRLILTRHVVPGKILLQGGTVGGSGVVKWLTEQICEYNQKIAEEKNLNVYKLFDDTAKNAPVGSGGVIFLPYMMGERSPVWDKNAKGVFYGLDFSKTKAHILRSALEGVAYSLRDNLEAAESAGAYADVLYSVGGAANSSLWMQIKSDVTNKKMFVASSDTAGTLGCAILAGIENGYYKSFAEAKQSTVKVTKEYIPNEENHNIYSKYFKIYKELYQNLKELMKKAGKI